MEAHGVSLRCGEKRVLDVRASQTVTLTNAGAVPVRVRLARRSGAEWVAFGPLVHLEPGCRWSRAAAELRCANLVVEVLCATPPDALRVSF